jgi:hypothetical protein
MEITKAIDQQVVIVAATGCEDGTPRVTQRIRGESLGLKQEGGCQKKKKNT